MGFLINAILFFLLSGPVLSLLVSNILLITFL
jgi:hypothetical protein